MINQEKAPEAKFVISIDTELAWGSVLFGENMIRKRELSFKKTRTAIAQVLNLFEKYELSATWALVGHLMLKSCSNENGIKHSDIIRPNYPWLKKDWFDLDPCIRNEENSIWYGDDIVDMIKNCKIKQEIGSHSFSHIKFGDKGCNESAAKSDINKWIEIAATHDVKPCSFVFPFNSEGHHQLLKQLGFTIYRGKNFNHYDKYKNHKLRHMAKILDRVLALCPTTGKVEPDSSGMLCSRGDFCYFRYNNWRNYLTWKSAVRKSKKGIDRAIDKGQVFHFWFHPFELAANINESMRDMDEILSYASGKIKVGLLENKTMSQLTL